MLNFSEMLEYERLKRGLTQEAFAEVLGIPRATLAYHLKGRIPTPGFIKIYSDKLGVDFAQIIIRQRRNKI